MAHTHAVILYEPLFHGRFSALVSDSTAEIADLSFLTYPSTSAVQELPIFTSTDRRLIGELQQAVPTAQLLTLDGPALWPRILDAIQSGDSQAAVDPGEPHGIRLTQQMILGMIQMYGTQDSTTVA